MQAGETIDILSIKKDLGNFPSPFNYELRITNSELLITY